MVCCALCSLTLVLLVLAVGSSRASFYPYEEPALRSEDKVFLPHLDPIALDSLMHEAKDIVVGRRKLEQDLVRHGRFTDMTKRTAVTRHQAVTTTFNTANDLEKSQEVFEEMTKLIARKLVSFFSSPLLLLLFLITDAMCDHGSCCC